MQRDGEGYSMSGLPGIGLEPDPQRHLREMSGEWVRRAYSVKMALLAGLSCGLSWAGAMYAIMTKTHATRVVFSIVGFIAAYRLTEIYLTHQKLKRTRLEILAHVDAAAGVIKTLLESEGRNPVEVAGIVLKYRENWEKMIP